MNNFRLLEHTADMGIAAEGETCAELFRQAALGLRRIITDCEDIRPQQDVMIDVGGEDREELLVNWLSELVFLLENRELLAADIEILEIGENRLLARVRGERIDPARHRLEREIKAVTYHRIKVEEGKSGWRAQVYVDL